MRKPKTSCLSRFRNMAVLRVPSFNFISKRKLLDMKKLQGFNSRSNCSLHCTFAVTRQRLTIPCAVTASTHPRSLVFGSTTTLTARHTNLQNKPGTHLHGKGSLHTTQKSLKKFTDRDGTSTN